MHSPTAIPKETEVSDPTELTIENSALVLIDHQPWVAFSLEVDSIALINNVTGVWRSRPRPSGCRPC
jgi:hypothetical protein